jgi:GntR family carbon starvation induced transcriptional regulator
VSACGSPRLLQIRRKLYDQSERYRKLEASLPRNRHPDDEHARITEAVLARDAPRATRLMREHISLTSENILKALTKKEAQLLRASNRTVKPRRRGPRS